VISENESNVFVHGIVFASTIANVWYWVVISKLNRKIKKVRDLEPIIEEKDKIIAEYEKLLTKQNLMLNDKCNCQSN
jgi:hypothetical protein